MSGFDSRKKESFAEILNALLIQFYKYIGQTLYIKILTFRAK